MYLIRFYTISGQPRTVSKMLKKNIKNMTRNVHSIFDHIVDNNYRNNKGSETWDTHYSLGMDLAQPSTQIMHLFKPLFSPGWPGPDQGGWAV